MKKTFNILLVESDFERLENEGYTPYGNYIVVTKKYYERLKSKKGAD